MQASADYGSIQAISQRLIEASEALAELTDRVAKARVVTNHDSDRRKRALSLAVRDVLANSETSAAAAEHKARASESYAELMATIGKDMLTAEKVIAEWEVRKIAWQTAQSLLAVQRQILSNI